MRLTHALALLVVAVLLTACAGDPPGWLRGDARLQPPGITNNG